MPTVLDLRLSLIWVESFLSLLQEPQPSAPRQFLGRPQSYAKLFSTWEAGPGEDATLAPPWSVEYARTFWRYYSEHRSGIIPPKQTWRLIVPIHARMPLTASSPATPYQLEAHGYLYPFGLALEMSCEIGPSSGGALSLYAAVDAAHAVVREDLQVQWEGAAALSQRLDPLASEALSRLRRGTLGESAEPEDESIRPFSVATFVLVEGEDSTAPPAQGSETHRALQALATWSVDWRNSTLGTLKNQRANIKSSAPPGHVLFADSRARVGWFPSSPTPADTENQRFRCYHRSQVCTALQLEALTRFARRFVQRLDLGKPIGPLEDQCARNAVLILGRMYGGSKATYRSDSSRLFVEQNGLGEIIDRILTRFNRPNLFTK